MVPGAVGRMFDDLPCDDVVPLTAGPSTLQHAEAACVALAMSQIPFHTDMPFDTRRMRFRWTLTRLTGGGGRWRWRMPVSIYVCRSDLEFARRVCEGTIPVHVLDP